MDTITFNLGSSVEHYVATTPEAAMATRDANYGWTTGWTFTPLSETSWHIHASQFIGTATLTTPPKGMVAYAGEYHTPDMAMFLAGY